MAGKKTPMRQCLGCREMKPKHEMLRVVRMTNGTVQIDVKGKTSGRGVYFCSAHCLERSAKSKALERVLGVSVPQGIYESLRAELEDNT